MPIHPDNPLRKITLNLYDADVVEMEHRFGYGWSEQVRRWVHQQLKADQPTTKRTMTVGDFLAGDDDGQ